MGDLVFVDELPPRGYSHGATEQRAKELQRNVNKWALWPSQTGKATLATSLSKFGKFEIEMRSVMVNDKRKTRPFVRFVGDVPAQPDPPPQSQSSPSLRSVPVSDPHALPTSFPCPACGDSLAMNAPFGESEKRRALSQHRLRERDCDQILKRRTR